MIGQRLGEYIYQSHTHQWLCPEHMDHFYKTSHQRPITQEKNRQEILNFCTKEEGT